MLGELLRQDLDCYFSPQLGVTSFVNLTHPALTDQGEDFVLRKHGTESK
jgi:hypothetical protein